MSHIMPRLSIPALFLAIVLAGCSSTIPATSSKIRREMLDIREKVLKNRGYMQKLGNMRVGKSGFFYIVDLRGRVVYHPQTAIIGSNFRNIWFMQKIFEDKEGCMKYRLGMRTHVVFFNQIDEEEILCLSILSEDLREPATDCMTVNREEQ